MLLSVVGMVATVSRSEKGGVSQEIYFYYYIDVSRNVKEKGGDRSVHQIYDCIL